MNLQMYTVSPPSFKWENWQADEMEHNIDSLKERKVTDMLKPLKLARQKHSREEMIFSLFLLK